MTCKIILISFFVVLLAGCSDETIYPLSTTTTTTSTTTTTTTIPPEKTVIAVSTKEFVYSGAAKVGTLEVSGAYDSFTEKTKNTLVWENINTGKPDVVYTQIVLSKSTKPASPTYYNCTLSIVAEVGYAFESIKQADFKVSSAEMLAIDGIENTEYISSLVRRTNAGDWLSRTEFDKLRDYIGEMSVRFYTAKGSLDMVIPSRFFELLRTL